MWLGSGQQLAKVDTDEVRDTGDTYEKAIKGEGWSGVKVHNAR